MDEDINNVFQKINSIMSDKNNSDSLKNILDKLASSSNNSTQTNNDTSEQKSNSDCNNSTEIPEFDINTIIKIKSIIDAMNNTKNDKRTNLLLSLKPYLKDSKKEKIDQYIKFLKIANVFEMLNPMEDQKSDDK